MISADCSRILDETARAYGFSESVRKADKESLEELLGCAVDIAKTSFVVCQHGNSVCRVWTQSTQICSATILH